MTATPSTRPQQQDPWFQALWQAAERASRRIGVPLPSILLMFTEDILSAHVETFGNSPEAQTHLRAAIDEIRIACSYL